MLGTDPSWAENRTPYGPLFLWLSRGVVAVTGAQPDISVLLFRAAGLHRRGTVRDLCTQDWRSFTA